MKTAELEQYAGRHAGESVVILANGATLNDHSPWHLPADIKVMGMNKSWKWLPGDRHANYHVVAIGDTRHFSDDGAFYRDMKGNGTTLFGIGATLLKRYRDIPMVLIRKRPSTVAHQIVFSADATHGVGIGIGPIGSVAFAALQLAVWLGFHRIYFLGLDLHGPHFHGEWPASDERLRHQDALFLAAKAYLSRKELHLRHVKVYNVGSPDTACTAFQKLTFVEAFGTRIASQPVEVTQCP